ncbi:MAG: hypothetical protein FVQ84_14460 [Planctomycetes bacterium]|nr:hypothetical protein [Planctomycetota bacterium]
MSKYNHLSPDLLEDDKLIPYGSAEAMAHSLQQVPVIFMIILHYITLGIGPLVWLDIAHSRIPKIRRNDPSAAKAFFNMLIPFYNLYWFFFKNIRLCERINEQRAMRSLPEKSLHGLAVNNSAILVAGAVLFGYPMDVSEPSAYTLFVAKALLLLWYGVLQPVYLGLIQHSVNELAIITYMENIDDTKVEEEN